MIALLTSLFLLIPSIRGFSLSAEQTVDMPGPVEQAVDQLAAAEVAELTGTH